MKSNNNYGTKICALKRLLVGLLFSLMVASAARAKAISFTKQQSDETAQSAAERVLRQSQEATRKDFKGSKIKGLIVNSRTEVSQPYPEDFVKKYPQLRNLRDEATTDTELAISFPDKIHEKRENSYPTNQQTLERTLNGNRFTQKSEVLVDGKPINFVANNAIEKSEKERIADFKDTTFLAVFPITLDYSWYSPIEFRYVGVAEAGGTRADVIETSLSDGTKYRFFFDQQTHLLLMAIETLMIEQTNKEIERRYFFSDYRKEDGLLVPHKAVIEVNKEVVGERQLKRLQINPSFKPDYFAVKGK
jgi:hypothetical protein